jgi:alkylated DNA repair dioxygenase AlkB
MSKKRTLDSFFTRPFQPQPSNKKPKLSPPAPVDFTDASTHSSYPFPIPRLPQAIHESLGFAPAAEPRAINDQPHLDLLYYAPYIPRDAEHALFTFLRAHLPFYRVTYSIKRGALDTQINTPRYTTVFGLDSTSLFAPTDDGGTILDANTKQPVPKTWYKCSPRPLPACLDELRRVTEASTGCRFNFCLVNYYASGEDSISYHSDDERFLGSEPAIASFSLGARRDFLMKHKPVPPSTATTGATTTPTKGMKESKPLKFPLASGDMILMRGQTQAHWLHSIPKRKGGDGGEKGRINITFRRAMVRGGTENYYRYNVGNGGVFGWDEARGEMRPWPWEG